jgi:hypothetical protein
MGTGSKAHKIGPSVMMPSLALVNSSWGDLVRGASVPDLLCYMYQIFLFIYLQNPKRQQINNNFFPTRSLLKLSYLGASFVHDPLATPAVSYHPHTASWSLQNSTCIYTAEFATEPSTTHKSREGLEGVLKQVPLKTT